jgi:prolyl-tRNA editing enzyme YbaK/EbsC (Cys-tRNA(Pro) deacylase)
MLNERDLENFLKERKVEFELAKFEENVISSEKAASQTNGVIVKNILLICDNNPLLCILLGKDKIDFDKIRREIGCKDIRLAKAREVKDITGYDIGAVPPIAHKQKIRRIVDKKIDELKKDEVIYCGGGSHYHLLKIRKENLLKVLGDIEIKDISE